MSEDYIELKPNDVIREGDELTLVSYDSGNYVVVVAAHVGTKVSEWKRLAFRRPRNVAIRDAAIELLQSYFGDCACAEHDLFEALREALGISIEQLRKGGNDE